MASFGKVDRYVSPTLWNPIAGTACSATGRRPAHARRYGASWRKRSRLLILDGRLTLQTRLPGERELAAALNVSRTTIASALGQLREEGFLYSRQGERVTHCFAGTPRRSSSACRHLIYA